MTSQIIQAQAKQFIRPMPDIQPGYTVRVHERIQEGSKERVQAFEGLVISVHRGHVPTDASFTVRKVVSGVGVEKIFAIHSPVLEKVEVKKVAKTRRAKLFFIRGRSGKSARMTERFTTEGEFATPEAEVAQEEVSQQEPVASEETPAEVETPVAEASVEPGEAKQEA